MTTYSFWDYDEEANKDMDICGTDYRELLSFCFLHGTKCSLYFEDANRYCPPLTIELSPWDFSLLQRIREKMIPCKHGVTWVFPCTTEMEFFLAKHCNSIFDWTIANKNPANLSFYRQNGSILFASNPHIGVCYFFSIKVKHWARFKRRGGS